MPISYAREQDLSADDYIAVLETTYMRDKRPLANRTRIAAMLRGSNVLVTARDEAGAIVGVARGISDGAWVCYLADLVIRADRQGEGIGRGLLDACAEILGPKIGIVLLAFEPAVPFYRRLGMGEMPGFFRNREDST